MKIANKFFLLASLLLLASCGGGGGCKTSIAFGLVADLACNDNRSYTISGYVLVGRIEGAQVCLDTNANQRCDDPSIDPQATTDVNGFFSIRYQGEVNGLHMIANVPVGAVDAELGVVTQAFTMMAPVLSSDTQRTIISPLTTLVSADMLERNVAAREAESSIQIHLGVTSAFLGYDYQSQNDKSISALALTTASALSEASALLNSDANIIQLNPSPEATFLATIAMVKDSFLPEVMGSGVLNGVAGYTRQQINSMVYPAITRVVSVNLEKITINLRMGYGYAVDFPFELNPVGIVSVSPETSYGYFDENEVKQYGNLSNTGKALSVNYYDAEFLNRPNEYKFSKILVGNRWYRHDDDSDEQVLMADGDAWVYGNGTPTFKNGCVEYIGPRTGAPVYSRCLRARNLSGKYMSSIIPNLCRNSAGQPIAGCSSGARFPQGSIAYDMFFSNLRDVYKLYVGKDWDGYPSGPEVNIYGFLAQAKSRPVGLGDNCKIAMLVDAYVEDTVPRASRGTVKWGTNVSGQGCSSVRISDVTESSAFEIVRVAGKDLVRMETTALYRTTLSEPTRHILFGAHQGSMRNGVWFGELSQANRLRKMPFSGDPRISDQIVSPIMLNSLFQQWGYTPLTY